jgi:peptidoglycan/xylan/chitin deacetylase (PgdA/CDA1 family)
MHPPVYDFEPNVVCFTFDVEWACQPVIDDVRSLLDDRGIVGTFFVTHAGVDVGRHERGLHPNFRRNGDVYRMLHDASSRSDIEVYQHVLETVMTFAPEARGSRSHSLFFDSSLLPIYERLGIEYDATFRLELVPNLHPFWKQHHIVEIPTYYADYFDMVSQTTDYNVESLALESPGLKVLDFHPNLVYINAPDVPTYDSTRAFYHDPEKLAAARYDGPGTRTLFLELLDYVTSHKRKTATLGEINAAVRASR